MYLIQTVQTTWRPQLPLPKEIHLSDDNEPSARHKPQLITDTQHSNNDCDKMHHTKKSDPLSGSQISQVGGNASKKWSFGRLFRKKKEIDAEDSTSEEDRKAGFVPPAKYARSTNSNVSSKSKLSHKSQQRSNKYEQAPGQTARQQQKQLRDHIDNEFFLPVETIAPQAVPLNQPEPFYQNQPYEQLLYVPQQPPQLAYVSRSTNSLDRRSARSAGSGAKSRSTQRLPTAQLGNVNVAPHSSSEEELISLNSTTFSKYRSDESIHSGGLVLAQSAASAQASRRSRAARNERYYKRLSRDGEVSHGQVPAMLTAPHPQATTPHRWKTQPVPLSIFNGQVTSHRPATATSTATINPTAALRAPAKLHSTSSLQHVAQPYVQWGHSQQQQQLLQQQQQQTKNLQNSVNEHKRSISYDSQIHLQNANGRMQRKPLPPPPPPRDPLRRVNVGNHLGNGSSGDLRPISYAFDQSGVPVLPTATGLNNRCVSDDRIWAPQTPAYQSMRSLYVPPTHQQQQQSSSPQHRRFITRAERDAQPGKKSLPNGLDFHYVADATPRSRKPIHMIEPSENATANEPASTGILRTTKSGLPNKQNASDFWKRIEEGNQRRGRDIERPLYNEPTSAKPRSMSSSRLCDMRSNQVPPIYSEIRKDRYKPMILQPTHGQDEVDNVVCGSLHIKPSVEDGQHNYVEIRHKDVNKSNSMPNHYQRRSGEMLATPNKYDEYVAEKREQHHKPIFNPPTPPQRKPLAPPTMPPTIPPLNFTRKKPTNLEEAINELEAIYKSLGLSEEPEEPKKKERIPTPSEFEKFALAHADEYEDEDSPTGEPDPVRDDAAYRSIQLANLQHKTADKQPPFGIPIGPIVPAPLTDYLHVKPEPLKQKQKFTSSTRAPDVVQDDLAVRTLRKDPAVPKEKFIYPSSAYQKKNRATRTQSANIYSLIQRDAAKPSGGDLYSYMELTRSIDRAGSMSDLHISESASDIPGTLALLRNLKAQDQEQAREQQQLTEQQQQAAQAKKMQIPFRHPSQGGAICQLPERLASPPKADLYKAPVPLPRKSLTPEPMVPSERHNQLDDALNKIAQDAQESSIRLTKELQELRKEALITAARPKRLTPEDEERLAKELQEIKAVSDAAKRCGKMLLDNLPDAHEGNNEGAEAAAKARKLHKEDKLIEAIDQVSEAANAVCEKILKDIVTTEPPVVVHEAVKVQNTKSGSTSAKKSNSVDALVMPSLIKKLDPIQSDKIEAIAKRCMRQLSELAENPDYDNLNSLAAVGASSACNNDTNIATEGATLADTTLISTVAEAPKQQPEQREAEPKAKQSGRTSKDIDEIDKIMLECEVQAKTTVENPMQAQIPGGSTSTATAIATATATGTGTVSGSASGSGIGSSSSSAGVPVTASSMSSSSDCLAKSSSPSASRRMSSSITSFNPYSSSDYLKSPSSELHAPSTDPIKTFSTTSYDVPSTSVTPNITNSHTTNSTFSYTPSPPLNLTPVSSGRSSSAAARAGAAAAAAAATERAQRSSSSSASQYNSSEELAAIFGIDEQHRRHNRKQRQSALALAANTGNVVAIPNQNNNKYNNKCKVKNHHLSSASTSASTTHALATAATNACKTKTLTNNPEANATNHPPSHPNRQSPDQTHARPELLTNTPAARMLNVDCNATTTTTTATPTASTSSANTAPQYQVQMQPQVPTPFNPTTTNPKPPITAISSAKLVSQGNAMEPSSETVKLSPNFNRIYNSKISILVDKPPAEELAQELHIDEDATDMPQTQLDSLSSLEEYSSNPDSGNVSLADFPLGNAPQANATLQLQTTYNSRFEIQNRFVNEVAITTEPNQLDERCDEQAKEDETEFEEKPMLAISKKPNIVYETPKLKMRLSEVKINYDVREDEEEEAEEEKEEEENELKTDEKDLATQELATNARRTTTVENSHEEEDKTQGGALHQTPEGAEASTTLLPWRQHNLRDMHDAPTPDEKPTTSGEQSLSILGETRTPNALTQLTTLEHMLIACTIGIITPNDLFTLFLVIIGIVLMIAIALF